MDKEKKLLKNTFIISIGKICTSLITFFLLPLYTGVLTTEQYGIVDLVNTLVLLFVPLVTLQLEHSVFRFLIESRKDEQKQSEIISTGVVQIIFQLSLMVLVCVIIFPFIDNNYKHFLILNLVSYSFLSFILQIARGIGEVKKYTVGSFVSALFTIIFNLICLLVIKIGAYGMLIGNFMGYFIAIIYMVISLKLYKYVDISIFKKSILKSLLKYSIPLIPNQLSWWIFNVSDRLIVSSMLGVDQNGILSASLKFSNIIIILYGIFDASWIESISENIDDEGISDYFNKMLNMVFNFFASMCMGLIAVMPFVFPIMINNNYLSGYGLVPISILASLFQVLQGLVAVVYAGKKNTKSIAKTSLTAAFVNIIVHLVLIKFIGLYAAVISTLVSFAVLSVYRLYDVNKKYFKIKVNFMIVSRLFILFLVQFILYYLNNIYLNIVFLIITIIYAIISNKVILRNLIRAIMKKIKE